MIISRRLLFSILFVVALTLPSICTAINYWINETTQVPAGGAKWWSGTLHAGDRLQGSFTSSGGDIKFFILDGTEFSRYQNGQSFTTYYSRQAIQVPGVDFTVPYDATWFVLLDNKYSIWTSKAVTVILTLNGGGGVGIDTIGIALVVFGILGALIVLWRVGQSINKSHSQKKSGSETRAENKEF